MAYVLIEHLVGDYETFKQVYLDDAERRLRSGSKGGKVFRVADDPNDIIMTLSGTLAMQIVITAKNSVENWGFFILISFG